MWELPDYIPTERPSPVNLAVIVATLLVAAWLIWNFTKEPEPQVGKTVVAAPAREVKVAPKIEVVPKKPIKVYKGGKKLKQKLSLPDSVVETKSAEVVTSSKVQADDHPHTITTVLDTDTGESVTYDRRDPLPWVAFSDRGSVGLYAGMKDGEPTARLEAKQELFTVKALRFGAVATIDQPLNSGQANTSYFVGIGAEYRW